MSQRNQMLSHGRPRIPSKQDLSEYTFGVPDSPQRVQRKKVLQRRSSKEIFSEESSTSPVVSREKSPNPFPTGDDPELRHSVCNDSLRPWTYLLTLPGKNVRDKLIDAFDSWIGCDSSQLKLIKQVVGYLHSASLIVDDIEDESATRRGFPAAHVKFGTAPALNAANYVYFLALEKVLHLQSTKAVEVYTEEMLNLHRGQGRDIFWRCESRVVDETEYLDMVIDKTGGLFRLAIRMMQAVGEKDSQQRLSDDEGEKGVSRIKSKKEENNLLISLSNRLACYFQVRDDLINLASPEFHRMKGFCEDITEGKFSFIVLHALRTLGKRPDAAELVNILNSKTTDVGLIKRALVILYKAGSFDYCLEYLDGLISQIHSDIASLGGNANLSNIVKALSVEVNDCRDVKTKVIEG